jgi:hypothetical protein
MKYRYYQEIICTVLSIFLRYFKDNSKDSLKLPPCLYKMYRIILNNMDIIYI